MPALSQPKNQPQLPADDTISSAVATLLQIFEDDLPDVSFPDVDGSRLGLASLEERANIVRRQTDELEALRAQVAASRDALESARVELGRHAERALAYAKLYAEAQPELSERLHALALGRGQRSKSRGSASKRAKRTKQAVLDEPATEASAQLPLGQDSPAQEIAAIAS